MNNFIFELLELDTLICWFQARRETIATETSKNRICVQLLWNGETDNKKWFLDLYKLFGIISKTSVSSNYSDTSDVSQFEIHCCKFFYFLWNTQIFYKFKWFYSHSCSIGSKMKLCIVDVLFIACVAQATFEGKWKRIFWITKFNFLCSVFYYFRSRRSRWTYRCIEGDD